MTSLTRNPQFVTRREPKKQPSATGGHVYQYTNMSEQIYLHELHGRTVKVGGQERKLTGKIRRYREEASSGSKSTIMSKQQAEVEGVKGVKGVAGSQYLSPASPAQWISIPAIQYQPITQGRWEPLTNYFVHKEDEEQERERGRRQILPPGPPLLSIMPIAASHKPRPQVGMQAPPMFLGASAVAATSSAAFGDDPNKIAPHPREMAKLGCGSCGGKGKVKGTGEGNR